MTTRKDRKDNLMDFDRRTHAIELDPKALETLRKSADIVQRRCIAIALAMRPRALSALFFGRRRG